MTEIVYKLENFDTPLENSRMIFLLGRSASASASASALPKLFDDLVNCPKLVSRVLIANHRSKTPLLFKGQWSAVFNPSDTKDWQLVLTYCTHMTRPGIVVIEDAVTVPEGFMSRLSALQVAVCRQLQSLPAGLLASADTVFLPLVEDLAGADADACLAVLKQQLGTGGASLEQKREWLREVRAARACLVWTRLRERTPAGAVYWFDPADGAENLRLPSQQARVTVRKLLAALGEMI
jgi:hypothetical protein